MKIQTASFAGLFPGLVAIALLAGCQAAPNGKTDRGQCAGRLHRAFLETDRLERGEGLGPEWNRLRQTLHAELRRVGDREFSEALVRESSAVRVSVVNCMGFRHPESYDPFPKTKQVLASTPKI